jgi:putative membrane protein
MGKFVLSLIINAIGLWLTTLLLAPNVRVEPYEQTALATVLTYTLVAIIFGIINGVIGTAIRIVAFPLYILTLGLLALIVNGLLLLLVSATSGLLGFGLYIEGFWWGVWGAIVLSIISWLLSLVLRPLGGRN